MKNLLVVLALLASGAVSAHAAADTTFDGPVRAPEPAMLVTTVKSSETVRGIDISSQTPTSIVIDTTQMFRQVCVQNLETITSLACGENPAVSTITTSNLIGIIVPPATSTSTVPSPTCFAIVPGRNFYCLGSKNTASSRAVVMRAR